MRPNIDSSVICDNSQIIHRVSSLSHFLTISRKSGANIFLNNCTYEYHTKIEASMGITNKDYLLWHMQFTLIPSYSREREWENVCSLK